MALNSGNNDLGENLQSENLSFLLKDNDQRRVIVYRADSAVITPCKRNESEEGGEEKKEKEKSFCKNYAGLLLTIFSGIIFSLGSVIVKFLKGYHPFTLSLYRFLGLLLPSIPLILFEKFVQKKDVFEPIWPLNEKGKLRTLVLIGARGALGCFSVVFNFSALQYLTVADTLVILSCTSIFVLLVACVTLKEKCGFFLTFVALLTILGVGIILRPPIFTNAGNFDKNILIGAGYAFCAMLSIVFAITLIRRLRKVHFAVVTFLGGALGAVISLALALSFGVFKLPENRRDWLLAIGLAFFAFLGQTSVTLALKYELAGTLTLVRSSDTVFAFIWQFLFLDVIPDMFSLIGAAIVIFGVILTAWSKSVSMLPADDPKRKKFSLLLK